MVTIWSENDISQSGFEIDIDTHLPVYISDTGETNNQRKSQVNKSNILKIELNKISK